MNYDNKTQPFYFKKCSTIFACSGLFGVDILFKSQKLKLYNYCSFQKLFQIDMYYTPARKLPKPKIKIKTIVLGIGIFENYVKIQFLTFIKRLSYLKKTQILFC